MKDDQRGRPPRPGRQIRCRLHAPTRTLGPPFGPCDPGSVSPVAWPLRWGPSTCGQSPADSDDGPRSTIHSDEHHHQNTNPEPTMDFDVVTYRCNSARAIASVGYRKMRFSCYSNGSRGVGHTLAILRFRTAENELWSRNWLFPKKRGTHRTGSVVGGTRRGSGVLSRACFVLGVAGIIGLSWSYFTRSWPVADLSSPRPICDRPTPWCKRPRA